MQKLHSQIKSMLTKHKKTLEQKEAILDRLRCSSLPCARMERTVKELKDSIRFKETQLGLN